MVRDKGRTESATAIHSRRVRTVLDCVEFAARRNIITFVLAIASAAGGSAQLEARPFALDDMLKLEGVGRGASDPSGRWIVWEQAPPYNRLPDYGTQPIVTWKGAYYLMKIDLRSTHPRPSYLFSPDPSREYFLDSFSPTGRFVIFYSVKAGRVSMGIFDFTTQKTHLISPAPMVNWYSGRESTWVDPEHFVYGAYREPGEPLLVRREAYGAFAWAAWNKSWRGKEPASTVATSHRNGLADHFRPGQLIEVDARTGRYATVADGQFEDLTLSSDRRYLAGLRQAPLDQPDPAVHEGNWVESRSQLMIFDLQNGFRATAVEAGLDVQINCLTWSPEQDNLAFFAWQRGASIQTGYFRSVDPRTMEVREFPHLGLDLASQRERGFYQVPERPVWVGERLAVVAREITGDTSKHTLTYRDMARDASPLQKADWFLLDTVGRHENLTVSFKKVDPIPLDGDGRSLTVLADDAVWQVEPGATPRVIVPNSYGALSLPLSFTDTMLQTPLRPAIVLVAKGERPGLIFVDLRRGAIRQVKGETEDANYIAASFSAGAALYQLYTPTSDVIALSTGDGKTLTLHRLDAALDGVDRGAWKSIEYTAHSSLGTKALASCILLPPDYLPGRQYPLIVSVYPSFQPSCSSKPLSRYRQMNGGINGLSPFLFAARDFIYLEPNTDKALENGPESPLAGMTDLVMSAVDALIARGYVDPSRIGLIGFSQGGFSSLWVATQTDRFKAVVSLNSWSDMYSHYYDGDYYWYRVSADDTPRSGNRIRYLSSAGSDFGIGKTPQEDLDAYVRNSPLFRAEQITAPTLLIHSDLDGFPFSQYEAMFTALYQLRKEAKLIEYWGEGHSPSSPANMRDMWQNINAWYDQYLDIARDENGGLIWEGSVAKARGTVH